MDRYVLRKEDYSLSEDQTDLQSAYQKFFKANCSIETVRAAEAVGFDKSLWERLCATGATTMALPESVGGDGATMVIPGSHKANFRHPRFDDAKMKSDEASSLDNVEGAVEVHLQKGDAILFVDAISHGSASRVNEGERRIVVYRYGPSWGNFRWPYQVSASLLERLTPTQRQIVQPQAPIKREPNRIPGTPSPLNARSA